MSQAQPLREGHVRATLDTWEFRVAATTGINGSLERGNCGSRKVRKSPCGRHLTQREAFDRLGLARVDQDLGQMQ